MMTYTLEQLSKALCVSKDAAKKRAAREGWPYTEQTCRGGRRRVYAWDALPADVRAAVERHVAEQAVAAMRSASTGESFPAAVPSAVDASPAATGAGGLARGGGVGYTFAAGGGAAPPQGYQIGCAATAAADAGNGPLTRGAGSTPAAPTLIDAPAGGAFEYPASSPAGAMPALPAAGAQAPAAGPFSRTDALLDAFLTRPESVQAEARRRFGILLQAKRAMDAGLPVRRALAEAAAASGESAATVLGWWYGRHGKVGVFDQPVEDWVPLLAPDYGVQARRQARFSGPAWDWALAQYLRPEKPSALRVYRDLCAAAPAMGWEVPSYATFERRLKAIPSAVAILAREGRRALEERLPALKRSVAHLGALEWVNADGHRFDVFVRFPERFGGGIGRPHLIAWQDVASRKILAYRLSPTLNALSVQLCFADLVETYGVPQHALMDNGREFGAKVMTGGVPWRFRFKVREDEPLGVLPMLGVEVHWATPFHGQAKPIERAFRDLCEEIARDPRCAGAYTGNAPDAKPENYGSKAMDWDAFERIVAEGIARHNARGGRRTETAKGESFDAAFARLYAGQVVRKLAPSQRAVLLLAAEGVTVRADGSVELLGNRYGSPELMAFAGKKVIVRFDPDRLDLPVRVDRLDGVHIADAQPMLARFDDQAAAVAHARMKAQAKRAARQQLDAIRRMGEIEARLPEVSPSAPPQPAVVQIVQAAQPACAVSSADAERYSRLAEAAVLGLSRAVGQ